VKEKERDSFLSLRERRGGGQYEWLFWAAEVLKKRGEK